MSSPKGSESRWRRWSRLPDRTTCRYWWRWWSGGEGSKLTESMAGTQVMVFDSLIVGSGVQGVFRMEEDLLDADRTSDATGGSLKTIGFAKKHKKPRLHLSQAGVGLFPPAMLLQEFVKEFGIKTLNAAGSRECKEPGIHKWVMHVLGAAFFNG